MMKKWVLPAGLFVFLLVGTSASADTIVLKSGQEVKGKIVERTNDYVKIEVEGIPLTYMADELQDSAPAAPPQAGAPPQASAPQAGAPQATASFAVPESVQPILQKDLQDMTAADYSAIIDAFKGLPAEPTAGMAGYYATLGLAYYQSGKFKEALDVAQRLIKVVPDSANTAALIGMSYKALGNKEASLEAFKNYASLETKKARTDEDRNRAQQVAKALNKDNAALKDLKRQAADLKKAKRPGDYEKGWVLEKIFG